MTLKSFVVIEINWIILRPGGKNAIPSWWAINLNFRQNSVLRAGSQLKVRKTFNFLYIRLEFFKKRFCTPFPYVFLDKTINWEIISYGFSLIFSGKERKCVWECLCEYVRVSVCVCVIERVFFLQVNIWTWDFFLEVAVKNKDFFHSPKVVPV